MDVLNDYNSADMQRAEWRRWARRFRALAKHHRDGVEDRFTGDELRRLREDLGLTQAQLGFFLRIGGSPAVIARTMRRLESGESRINGPLELSIEYVFRRLTGNVIAL